MSTVPQERETEQIIGVVTGVVHKGEDKYQAVVAPDGSQYSKNLWTKDVALVSYLSQAIGQRLAFLCNASHWTRNDGQQVRSLWIDQVGPPTVGSPAMAGPQQQPQPQQQDWPAQPPPGLFPPTQAPMPVVPVTPTVTQGTPTGFVDQGVKEERIMREAASKVAAIMLSHVAPEERTMATLFVLSERLVAYYREGLPAVQPVTLDDLIIQAMPAGIEDVRRDPSLLDQPPPHTDSDIPF